MDDSEIIKKFHEDSAKTGIRMAIPFDDLPDIDDGGQVKITLKVKKRLKTPVTVKTIKKSKGGLQI